MTLPHPKQTAEARILVVEDEARMRDLLVRALEGWGFAVDSARSGEEAITKALQINPEHYRANLLLGRLLAMQSDFKGALPYLEKAVQLQPQSADAHKILGNAYGGLGQNDKARREQGEAQRLQATTPP